MKKNVLILFAILLIIKTMAFAQEENLTEISSGNQEASSAVKTGGNLLALGLAPEMNMNSRENFALGLCLNLDFNLGSVFGLGLTVTVSNNFDNFTVIEPAALFRWYILGNNYSGLFIQTDLGLYLFIDEWETKPLFLGGLRGGFRIPMGNMFYLEPYGRVGYPFLFGYGLTTGLRF